MPSERLKRALWIAPSSTENGVRVYGTPVLYHWNWRALSSGIDMMTFGPAYKDYRRATTTNAEIENIKQFDRVWMDTTPSDPTDILATDADFYVLSADAGAGGYAQVAFKRLSSDV